MEPSMSFQIWEVVGGVGWGKGGGIVVREGKDGSSPRLPERLKTGALVRGLEEQGGRLRYEKVLGDGPRSGWISIQLSSGHPLVRKTKKLSWSQGHLG
mmetsp:Transcript_49047/g.151413  ORF Transcript_49047/g.151413 Transcript_49047/m.151413 type:complete len:98 (+) Transcript_49047:165-458(+)